MRIIIIMLCLFSVGFSVCNDKYEKGENKRQPSIKKGQKDIERIQKIMTENLKEDMKKFNNKSLLYKVVLTINKNGEMCYYSIEKSKDEEYNKFIEKFIKNENGKIYYNDPIISEVNIDIKPFEINK